jgi:hypothetical protein
MQSNQQLKKCTLDQVKDELIGQVGTPSRDAYEIKLEKELLEINKKAD